MRDIDVLRAQIRAQEALIGALNEVHAAACHHLGMTAPCTDTGDPAARCGFDRCTRCRLIARLEMANLLGAGVKR